mgnify:CR=1 FL=1
MVIEIKKDEKTPETSPETIPTQQQSTGQIPKLGGPYTKSEQEIRRDQVYEMYFQKAMSAVKIAAELNVNRNTVNSDIRFWMSEIGSKYGKNSKVNSILLGLEFLDSQKSRLTEKLVDLDFESTYKLEKLIFEIEHKRISFISKMSPTANISADITLEMLSGIIKQLCHSELIKFHESVGISSLKKALMRITLDSSIPIDEFFEALMRSGLELYKVKSSLIGLEVEESYKLLDFAIARKVISNNEKKEILKSDEKNCEKY